MTEEQAMFDAKIYSLIAKCKYPDCSNITVKLLHRVMDTELTVEELIEKLKEMKTPPFRSLEVVSDKGLCVVGASWTISGLKATDKVNINPVIME